MKPNYKIVSSFRYIGTTAYTGNPNTKIELTLACGHKIVRKVSQGVPSRTHCPECQKALESCSQPSPQQL